MLRTIKGGILILLLLAVKSINAQNYYNSPYTRYLVGDIINSGFAYNRALGGSSIALRPHNQINYLNPASYTEQDTNSFLFQVGFTGRSATILTGVDTDKSTNFNIDYLALGFPVTRWWNVSIGATPFSRAQYFFSEKYIDSNVGEEVTKEYNGFGGLNEFYFGNAFNLRDDLSIGFNVNYIFGSIDRTQKSYLSEKSATSALIQNMSNYVASDFYFKSGIQYHPTIGEKHQLVAGLTYDFQSDIDIKVSNRSLRLNTVNNAVFPVDTLFNDIDSANTLVLPSKIGLGISYTYDKKLTFSAEYINQDWSGTEIATSNFKTGLYESYRFGAEFTPVPIHNRLRVNYLKNITYRAGAYTTNTYLNSNTTNIKDMGVSVGFGLPLKNARKTFSGTYFNIGYQYGNRGTTENDLIKEKYQIITFGITLHDFWFLKPKYN